MFFILSKVLWWLVTPSNLMILGTFLGLILMGTRFSVFGGRLAFCAASLLVLCSIIPSWIWIREPLENRFPVQSVAGLNPTGIIVLGGTMDEVLTEARGGQASVRFAAGRVTEAMVLAMAYPQTKLILTGGNSAVFAAKNALTEADIMADLLVAMGLPRERLVIENKSLNTDQNVEYVLKLINAKAGDRWILLTSAYHMPRSVGIFRKQGLEVVPYPVDFATTGHWHARLKPQQPASEGLRMFDQTVREWIGLVAYYVAGKTSALFPKP